MHSISSRTPACSTKCRTCCSPACDRASKQMSVLIRRADRPEHVLIALVRLSHLLRSRYADGICSQLRAALRPRVVFNDASGIWPEHSRNWANRLRLSSSPPLRCFRISEAPPRHVHDCRQRAPEEIPFGGDAVSEGAPFSVRRLRDGPSGSQTRGTCAHPPLPHPEQPRASRAERFACCKLGALYLSTPKECSQG